jgi:hypothetical protein
MDLDGLGIEFETLLLVDQEFLHIFALIALELDHLSHLSIVDDGAIASCYTVLVELYRDKLSSHETNRISS